MPSVALPRRRGLTAPHLSRRSLRSCANGGRMTSSCHGYVSALGRTSKHETHLMLAIPTLRPISTIRGSVHSLATHSEGLSGIKESPTPITSRHISNSSLCLSRVGVRPSVLPSPSIMSSSPRSTALLGPPSAIASDALLVHTEELIWLSQWTTETRRMSTLPLSIP